MKNEFIALIILFLLVSCQSRQQVTENISTIDSILQVNVTSLLENKLSELDALSGQAIVMEVQSGQIKALVGLTRKDSTNYQSCENFSVWQSTGLMHPISLLVALETGKVKLSDKVDTGNGIYQIHGRELKDHNWHRGGYGELTVQEGLAVSSNIAIYKTMEKAFGNNPQSYFDLLANMSYGKPDSITGIANLKPAHFITPKDNNWTKSDFAWSSIGYNQQILPIQILTFYNAIANNGKMIQPQLYKDSVVVINPQIASRASIDSLKKALVFNITDGLGQPAKSDKVVVAGMQGTSSLSINEDRTKDMYAVEFCGYFPANNPKYSIIVSINKAGLPASGELMAGDVFKKIVGLLFPC
ncbi:penicillin-binding transpeptidase domain-containing protein [Bacteroides caccae]|jgi:cell division protein FtsI (penicillin-binding protein 3)|uniref:penicillin-binding transpeptidase domain-containing protein n=1 Tax=Bacteroides caccae TaxID=47678 RepID=UPI0028F3EF32|nr:penicillin-binding transpeptidase domain-containing protein [Bacteroides caccae]WOG12169.1 penicillin-binding transpeptidase domain-containing protein [Bacteroides caccae]